MARRKLNAFTADDAGDNFTPTVKTVKGADVEDIVAEDVSSKKKKNSKAKKNEAGNREEVKSKVDPKSQQKSELKIEAEFETVDDVPARKISQAPIKKEEQNRSAIQKDKSSVGISREDHTLEQGSEEIVQLVGFILGNEEYGVDIQKVQEINRILEITRVPRTPEFVMGVINLRGNVIPVINLRERFGLPQKDIDKDVRIVVVEVQTKIIGILVDAVSEVLRIPASTIEPPPDIVAGVDSEYIKGVGKLQDRLLILLDLDKILSHAQVGKLDEVT